MTPSKQIYCTVLRNISKNTDLETEANQKIEQFHQDAKKYPEMTAKFWQCRAQADFYELLQEKIKLLQKMQKDCIEQIMFLNTN